MSEQPKDAIRDAATVVLVRRDGDEPRVLMGQRGKSAAFMPSKFVFPGGAIDVQDRAVAAPDALTERCRAALANRSDPALGAVLAMTAIRELWEESGLAIARRSADPAPDVPADWTAFYAAGLRPAPEALSFIFRAITPPGRPRRFDARFFLADASAVEGDLDDFSRAADELSHLSWLTISQARNLDLPFITEVVLAELEARLREGDRPIPFFYHQDGASHIDRL